MVPSPRVQTATRQSGPVARSMGAAARASASALARARPGVGVEVGEVGDGEVGYGFGLRGDGALGTVPGGEGGAQYGVPVGEGVQGGGEAVRVEGAVGLGVVAEDVGGGARVDLLEQSQAELDRAGLGAAGAVVSGVRARQRARRSRPRSADT